MSSKNLTAEQFLKAIPGSGGIITTIAKRIGCDWHTARKFIDSHPTVLQAYINEQESILDMAEGILYKSIIAGDTQDAKWILTRKGKHRGYVERSEVTGKDGEPLSITTIEVVRDGK